MTIKQKEPNIVEDNDDSIISEEDNEKDKPQDAEEDIYLDLSNVKFI